MRKPFFIVAVPVVILACVVPGLSAPAVAPLPTFDSNVIGTVIAETAAAAQTQTALKLPTVTQTPKPTLTPSLTPTFTPTFIFRLPTLTPIPTFTLPVTATSTQSSAGRGGDEDEDKKKEREDPRKMTGKEWSCVVVGIYPPRNTVFKPGVNFHVQWTVFNSGTKFWPLTGLDFVYEGGWRHEGTRIQDFKTSVPSGGEIKVGASFIAPKRAGEYQTFFHLMVGKLDFCYMIYTFQVVE